MLFIPPLKLICSGNVPHICRISRFTQNSPLWYPTSTRGKLDKVSITIATVDTKGQLKHCDTIISHALHLMQKQNVFNQLLWYNDDIVKQAYFNTPPMMADLIYFVRLCRFLILQVAGTNLWTQDNNFSKSKLTNDDVSQVSIPVEVASKVITVMDGRLLFIILTCDGNKGSKI